jgi:hypothetical protein
MNEFLSKILQFSEGDPGAIVALVETAKHPKYQSTNTSNQTTPYRLSHELESRRVICMHGPLTQVGWFLQDGVRILQVIGHDARKVGTFAQLES